MRLVHVVIYSQHVRLVHVVYSQHMRLVHVVTANTCGLCMCFTRWVFFYHAHASHCHSLVGISTVGQQDVTYTIVDIPLYFYRIEGSRMITSCLFYSIFSSAFRLFFIPGPPQISLVSLWHQIVQYAGIVSSAAFVMGLFFFVSGACHVNLLAW